MSDMASERGGIIRLLMLKLFKIVLKKQSRLIGRDFVMIRGLESDFESE